MIRFYQSPRWRALRLAALKRDHWHCVICGVSVSAKGTARVDHIHPRKTHPHLELSLDNLRTLCTTCDAQGHREKGQARGSPRCARFDAFDRNGVPLDPNHHWNRETGAGGRSFSSTRGGAENVGSPGTELEFAL